MPTPRLGLPTPAGTALVSTGDNDITSLANILDRAAIWLVPGTFAARPAASGNDGRFYLTTDSLVLYVSDGTNWHEVSRLGGSVPIGGLLDYAGANDPADTRYLLADGRAISRATYATAFGVMGTQYGAGDGSTTFNIPDVRGRTAVGPDNMGTGAGSAGRMASNNTRGAGGGTETKTLAEANLPSHTHGTGTLVTASAGAHDHSVGTLVTASDGAHAHGVGTYSTGSAGTHNHGGITGGHAHNVGASDHPLQMVVDVNWSNLGGTGTPIGASGNIQDVGGGGSGAPIKNQASATDSQGAGIASDGAHSHTVSGTSASAGAHTHTITGSVASSGAHTHTISGATAATGSGTALNGMPPYVVLNKIVRVS